MPCQPETRIGGPPAARCTARPLLAWVGATVAWGVAFGLGLTLGLAAGLSLLDLLH